MKQHWVYDFETLSNCFIAVFEHYMTEERRIFVVHELQNDLPAFIDFLKESKRGKSWFISFNGNSFDNQIVEYVLRNASIFLQSSPDDIAKAIYAKAQEIIQGQNARQWPEYSEKDFQISQVDLFKMNHWDNPNKRSSLKWIQFAIDWHNIQEMPIHHGATITTMDEIKFVTEYCINDVTSTKQVMHLCKAQIGMRSSIAQKYNLPCYSYSNTKIGSELLLRLYCQKTGKSIWDVKKWRTHRDEIHLKEVIFPYVEFKTPEFQGLLQRIKEKVIRNTKGDFKYTQKFRGYEFDYGLGGIHQCIQRGIYLSDDEYIIKDLDVASLYPSIAVVNGMYPAHLGREFYEVYKNDIVDVRLAEKRKGANGDKAIIEGFKEAANASYGNSNSQYSWLYDPQYTMQTTINGQLMLTMLVEELLISLDSAQLLQTNTDGATLRIKRTDIAKYDEICKRWEELTKLTLEFVDYSAMYIWDVNNYIAVYADGKKSPKCKGRFEWEDLQNHKPSHLHKNKSYLIVSKAIFNYFINNIPPEKFLQENRNIFDYCAGERIKGSGWEFRQTCIVNGQVESTSLQKTIRYFVSNNGCKIVKHNIEDGRTIQLESGKWMQTVMNIYEKKKWEEYDINETFYLNKIYDEIGSLVPKPNPQLSLFNG